MKDVLRKGLVQHRNHDLLQWLTHTDLLFFTERKNQGRGTLSDFHLVFQRRIDHRLVHQREICQMNRINGMPSCYAIQIGEQLIHEERCDR